MTWFQDLSNCTYWDRSDEQFSQSLVAVGWLEWDHDFQRGVVAPSVLDRLCELLIDPWENHHYRFRGVHTCTLCPSPTSQGHGFGSFRHRFGHKWRYLELGGSNLFIPGHGFLYATPSLIAHYIASHQYLPPPEFCEALLACPPMHSDAYFEAVEENGPPTWAAQVVEDAEREHWIREAIAKETRPLGLLIVDSHQETHSWFQQLASEREDISIVDQVWSADEILARSQPIDFDIAFIDLQLPNEAALDIYFQTNRWKIDIPPQSCFLHHRCTEESNGYLEFQKRIGMVHQYYCWPLSNDELEILIQAAQRHRAYWSLDWPRA